MLNVQKKNRRTLRHGRLWLLIGTAVLACIVGGTWALLTHTPQPRPISTDHITYQELAVHPAEDVRRIAITLRSGESWAAVQSAAGVLTLEDDADYQVSAGMAQSLLEAARVISCEDVLSEHWADHRDRLADFGLDNPRVTAAFSYADGTQWVLHIGNAISLHESNAYYMIIDGDERLFSLDKGTAENLMVERNLLHPVAQPVLHKARFDRITFTAGDGTTLAEWTLQGSIGGNAQDRWLLTAPLRYPADGEAISSLHANLQNLRLGAYVGEATPENLTACGFDTPRMIITVHQAAGSIGTTDASGVYTVTDWPEDTFTLTIGGAKSDAVDYVLVDGKIYISSHFTLDVFMTMDATATLSRYTVPVALGNLQRLTIRTGDSQQVYTLTRTEQVAENNDLVTDMNGNVVYDVACDLNGAAFPYASFESAYNDLLKVTVSGNLPDGWSTDVPPHTSFVFEAVTGERYTLSLASFDAMHDAVFMDGHALFYLIKGGMVLDAE